nr:hypothetical protein GCM10020063_084700 [Dactylosporangium thailandense]
MRPNRPAPAPRQAAKDRTKNPARRNAGPGACDKLDGVVDPQSLTRDLRAFRKGRAAGNPVFASRLGGALRTLAGITGADTTAQARTKLREALEPVLREHAPALLLPGLAQFALLPDAMLETLEERQAWLAERERYGIRTARRRMDEALDAFVAAAAGTTGSAAGGRAPGGWRTRSLEGVLDLTTDGPRLTERRVVEFVDDGVDEIACRLSAPGRDGSRPAPAPPAVDVLFGVAIAGQTHPSADHHQYRLRLPRAFGAGDRHEYAMAFRFPPGTAVAPHYVMQPLTPCEHFKLIVRFDPGRPPRQAWKLDGVAPRVVDGGRQGERLSPDGLGELHHEFWRLHEGLAYGVRWTPQASPP